jgi:hypothetical protein
MLPRNWGFAKAPTVGNAETNRVLKEAQKVFI